ncbi:HAD hydrolase-like protein [Stenotrophomonas maltophilia]|uniref:HAD hydrolase-like protein n=1 Tax=Stenotrophomonas maltophilia TaxID=40324 RepID=UPI000DA2B0F5|nr:HAD hydrolase-like protein [Stenotrophomonas maltophilia]MDP9619804.1 HAD superfamily hydrolase (TIGR01509 family) [Stenotrophomonas maltophilia]SQG10254.1 pyrophosphatase PpaX [Stenotrophomonas maltophilia]
MFEVCLFDLDQTLVETEDMKELRESGKGRDDARYVEEVVKAFKKKTRADRLIYAETLLAEIREKFPNMKLGVFTRSPKSYAQAILDNAYPSLNWDVVVAYEDVEHTKPYGEGIDKAMWSFGLQNISKVVLVGDGDADVRAAYNAGCVVILDKSTWAARNNPDNWRALGRIPDAVISSPRDIIDVLSGYCKYLPELERLLSGEIERAGASRFDKINKFIPKGVGGDSTAFPIYCCGRSFAGYKSLEWRKKWHLLTHSIHDQKDADVFPDEWIEAVRTFISTQFWTLGLGGSLLVSVVPHRPGRKPRLEAFLSQLEDSYRQSPLKGKGKLEFLPDLLAYKAGVLSNSNDKLSATERFENIRDHLFLQRKSAAEDGGRFLIIDDVATTGSSLIYAKKSLTEAGANEVVCLSIAMNVSNVLYD